MAISNFFIQFPTFFSAFGTNSHHHSHQIPTISVSVQTEPSMVNTNGTGTGCNGLANTAALLGEKFMTSEFQQTIDQFCCID